MANFTVQDSIDLAWKLHEGQFDKQGEEYIYHPLAVMENARDELEEIGFVLHDVVEDCDITLDELADRGVPPKSLEIIRLLTREKGMSYTEFIDRLVDSQNESAIFGKMQDIRHNLDPDRFVDDSSWLSRIKKYYLAYNKLKKAFEKLNTRPM